MRDRLLDVPDAELAVLKVLWDRGSATIRQIVAVLYPGGESSAHATVQKLLERLSQRGCVQRRRQGRVHVYAADVDRDDLIRHRLREAADRLCEGSLAPLLTQLVRSPQLTSAEIAELRELVEGLEAGRAGKRGEP